jgi:hypothetical protein
MGDAVEIIFLWFKRQEEAEEEEEEERENLKFFSQDLFVSYNQKLCCSSCREQQTDLFPQCLLQNNFSNQLVVVKNQLDFQHHPPPPPQRQSHIPVAKLGSVSS